MIKRSFWYLSIFFVLIYCENVFCDSESFEEIRSKLDARQQEIDGSVSSAIRSFVFVWEGCIKYDSYSWCKNVDDSEKIGRKTVVGLIKEEINRGNIDDVMSFLDRMQNTEYMLKLTNSSESSYNHAYTSIIIPAIRTVLNEYNIKCKSLWNWSDVRENISDGLINVINQIKVQGDCANNFKDNME